MKIFERSGLSILVMLIMATLVFAPTANAQGNSSQKELITESGQKIGFGKPKVNSNDVTTKIVKSKSNNVNLENIIQNSKEREVLKQTITVQESSKDITVEVPFKFDNREYLVLIRDEEGNLDGTGNIYNKNHKSIGVFSAKIVDNKQNVKINQKVKENDVLEFNIEPSGSTESITLEVTAQATYYSDYFYDFNWISLSGGKTLSLYATSYLRTLGWESASIRTDAWDKLYAVHGSSQYWYNTGGMSDQFYCHVDFAKNKTPWNLDPWRPNVSYWATVNAQCNP
ncbi:DUF2599 domain-containing protein [Pseudalkalibacillus sp. NRS-1564]|uniref:DUF2599 domain-containing protein n=1 Tax=Pseudalkalibacillus sp. NRS-1564 TaxID=3233900 RepID=UPI003D29DAB5